MTHTKEELIALAKEAGMVISYACTYRNHEFCPCSSSKDEFCLGNEPYDIRSASFESLEKLAALLTASNAEEVKPFAWAASFISGGYDFKTNLRDIEGNYTGKPFPLYTAPPASEQLVREALEKAAKVCDEAAEDCRKFGTPLSTQLALDLARQIRTLIPDSKG